MSAKADSCARSAIKGPHFSVGHGDEPIPNYGSEIALRAQLSAFADTAASKTPRFHPPNNR